MSANNNVTLYGRLTRDPELRQAQSGTHIVNFSIAVDEREPDGRGGYEDRSSYFDCVMFGKRAESLDRFFSKGRPIMISGRLRQDRWKDKESGGNRSKVKIIADDWSFSIRDKEDTRGSGGSGGGHPESPPHPADTPGFSQGSMIGSADVPF